MNLNIRRWSAFGASLLIVASLTACSDSSTKPKNTDPYPNTRLLISGESLAGNLTAANQVIVDARAADKYATAHVPGAISLPITGGTGLFDQGGTGTNSTDLKPPAEIAAVLSQAGITETTTIVIYGNGIDTQVGRMFWMLEYLGATDVRVLDGGFDKWNADGRTTSTTPNSLTAKTFTPHVVAERLTLKEGVLAHYQDTSHYAIVDSRNTVDFDALRIPHAINILTSDYINADGTMKSSIELDALFAQKHVASSQHVITHCYIGYRSSQGYFVFRLMGYDVSHYDGSWTEWNADPTTPKES